MSEKKNLETKAGRYAYEGLDRIMHEKARLGILTTLLARPEGVLFNELKELCSLTDGNLSRHIGALQEAGLVEIWKGFRGKRPQTLCRLSKEGRDRFLKYLAELQKVIEDAAAARKAAPVNEQSSKNPFAQDWIPIRS